MSTRLRVSLPLLALLLTACGRYGYDLVAAGDPSYAHDDDGGQGDGDGDGDADGTGDGDGDGDGDTDAGMGDGDGDAGPGGDGDGDASVGDGDGDGDGGQLVVCPGDPDPNVALVNRYSFSRSDTLVEDSISGRHGSTTSASQGSGIVTVSGVSTSYVQLPSGLVSSHSAVTIMAWVRWNSGPQSQAVFDFGQSATNQFELLASVPGYGVTTRYTTPSSSFEINSSSFLNMTFRHVAVVVDGVSDTVLLYVDGSPQISIAVPGLDLAALRDDNMWLGRSNGSANPFNGDYSELRIYGSRLSTCNVAAVYDRGPDAL